MIQAKGIYTLLRIVFEDNKPDVQLLEYTNDKYTFEWWQRHFKTDFLFRGWEVWEARYEDEQYKFHTRHFACHHEGEYKKHPLSILGATGYAYLHASEGDLRKVCYVCAGNIDKEHMDKHGYITLHLDGLMSLRNHMLAREHKHKTPTGVKINVSNWCGSLSYPVDLVRVGNGGMMRVRRDIWFTDHNGDQWYGLQLGNASPLVYCRRIKGKKDGEDKGRDRSNITEESRGEDRSGEEGSRRKQKPKRLLVGSTSSV